MRKSALTRRAPLKTDPGKAREFADRARRNSRPKRGPVSPASPAQRDKVRDRCCANCGAGNCDPAHLASRAQGGCDSPDCVLPLCRLCHRDFDDGCLDLEPVLALPEFAVERSHMAGHMSLSQCIKRLRGRAA